MRFDDRVPLKMEESVARGPMPLATLVNSPNGPQRSSAPHTGMEPQSSCSFLSIPRTSISRVRHKADGDGPHPGSESSSTPTGSTLVADFAAWEYANVASTKSALFSAGVTIDAPNPDDPGSARRDTRSACSWCSKRHEKHTKKSSVCSNRGVVDAVNTSLARFDMRREVPSSVHTSRTYISGIIMPCSAPPHPTHTHTHTPAINQTRNTNRA